MCVRFRVRLIGWILDFFDVWKNFFIVWCGVYVYKCF